MAVSTSVCIYSSINIFVGFQTGSLAEPEVFISYCWTNSASAVEADQARHKPGALSAGDPRKIKSFLEERGIVTWLDIERAGRVS